MTFRPKPIHQMRPEKTRASGDNGNGLGTFGHCGCVLIAAGDVYQQEVRRGGITNNCRALDSFAPAPSPMMPVYDARLPPTPFSETPRRLTQTPYRFRS